MSQKYYSPATNQFYLAALRKQYEKSGTWPSDAIEISEQDWEMYGIAIPPFGYERKPDKKGRPSWKAIPEKTAEELLDHERRGMRVSKVQLKVAMQEKEILNDVNIKINVMDSMALLVWTEADTFGRYNEMLVEVLGLLGYSDTNIDDLFRQAMKVKI